MLQLLHIENIAVIEEADITFCDGFNALTGETGAGKSIVIDAMGAVLGQRTSRDLIRTGASKAFVSAVFTGVSEDLPPLLEQGIAPEEGELMLQREIYADGKNVCRINGRPATVAQLRQIGGYLLNIHGQHDGQLLLDEERHCDYLDSFGCLQNELDAYRNEYCQVESLRREIRGLRMDESERERRIDALQHQIEELENAQLRPGEEEELLERRNILRNSEKFLSAIQGADYLLNGDDDTSGAVSQLREAEAALNSVKAFGGQFEQLSQRLHALSCEAYDVAETIRDLGESYDFSPAELDAVESRTDQLYRLKKKYGATVDDMLDYLEKSRRELDEIAYADDTAERLEKKLQEALKKAEAAASTLREKRTEAARSLERRIQDELRQLDMPKVRFSISITPVELGANGGDEVRFLMSANVGEDLKPIHKIASGGELARIMLALKNVLAENESVGTLVFDEVDTGVSGRAAQKVAEKLAQVSRKKQVLCVTHLPQLAAMADTHFSVEKGERNGRTYTAVQTLTRDQRRAELARLTGGTRISPAILEGAEELLAGAEEYKAQYEKTQAQ